MKAISLDNKDFDIEEPFKGLFTQGMVCHETYKDNENNWISPDEIITVDGEKYLKNDKSIKIKVGPSESMSKSKKNTVDPEKIIANFGADSVRLFILSDSPPEKDIQWSEEGIEASYKFIQKLWSLHKKIISEIDNENPKNEGKNLEKITNNFIKQITNNIENFNYNKTIANIHELYSSINKEINLKYKKDLIIKNYKKILICLIPIIPHFSNEALDNLNVKEDIKWPNFDNKILIEDRLPFVIQVNGKKRGVIETHRNTNEEDLLKIIYKDMKLKKYFENKEIKRKIFVPNKLINLIV